MGISRAFLAPYFGQTITLSGTTTDSQRGRLSLLININKGHDFITDHLWLMLPRNILYPGQRIRVRGIVSKYTHEGTLEESYGLKKVQIVG